jgi:hypothetical protein
VLPDTTSARQSSSLRVALVVGVALTAAACRETLDAGHSRPHGPLPIDERNPVILYNDAERDNWFGEYALLFANSGRLPLVGLVVTTSSYWEDLNANTSGWKELLDSAQSSGFKNIPSLMASPAPLLKHPADGVIENTTRNNSEGANLIVNLSSQIAEPYRPLVVIGGSRLTDVADAYLIDPSVVHRVVVVASLGGYSASTATMDAPNGELDPWADWIVAHKFRYVQVSAFYQQTLDIAASELPSLPPTPFGDRMRNKQPSILTFTTASDQVGVLSVASPGFAAEVKRFSPDPAATFDMVSGPPLIPDPDGNAWVVTKIQPPLAKSTLWLMLIKGADAGASVSP